MLNLVCVENSGISVSIQKCKKCTVRRNKLGMKNQQRPTLMQYNETFVSTIDFVLDPSV